MKLRAFLLLPCFLVFAHCTRLPAPDPLTYNPMDRYAFDCTPIDSLYVDAHLAGLEKLFGANLHAGKYRDKLLAALAFYPQLRGVEIYLKRRPLRTSMAARPLRLGGNRDRRRYAIYVDDVTERPSDFRRASYSAQVGCFIHELGHVSHYERTPNAELIYEGTAYVTNQEFKNDYERIADDYAIRNGGGYYLYQYRTFTFEEADLSAAYRAFKERNYTSNGELLEKHRAHLRERNLPPCGAE